MSSVREGMDADRIRSIAGEVAALGRQADGIHDAGAVMLRTLEGVWEGDDLAGFQRGWQEAGPQMAAAAEALRAAGETLRRQAGDQEAASGGDGSGAGGGGGGWSLPDFDFPDLNPFDDFDWDLPDVEWPTMDIGGFFDGLGDGIVDLLETIGDWWDDIPWWGQLIIGVVVAAVAVVVAVFLGAPVGAAIAVVALVVGAIMTILDIADALAEFFRDPGEFIDRLLEDPLAALGDLAWLLVGFLPYGIGKLLQRFRKPLRELIERIGPTIGRKLDDAIAWARRKWDDLSARVRHKIQEWDDRLHGRPHPGSPVSRGEEWHGTGTGRNRNAFPDEAEPNEVLYRTDGNGRVTYYQEYGPDGLPTKRVDINPNSAPHNGIPPPHVQEYTRHTNPRTGETFVRRGPVRPATPEEVQNL